MDCFWTINKTKQRLKEAEKDTQHDSAFLLDVAPNSFEFMEIVLIKYQHEVCSQKYIFLD